MYHHARFWQYTGNHPSGCDCMRYDPKGYGLDACQALAYLIEAGEVEVFGVSMEGATVRFSRDGGHFGRVVRLKATPEQWEAAKRWDVEVNRAQRACQ